MNNEFLLLNEQKEDELILQKMEVFINDNPEFVKKYDDFVNAYIEIQTKEGEMLKEMLKNMTDPCILYINKIKIMENELLELIYPVLIIHEELKVMDSEIRWSEIFQQLYNVFYDFESLIRETKADIIKKQAQRIKLSQDCVSELRNTMW